MEKSIWYLNSLIFICVHLKQYFVGPIVHINVCGQHIVILNDIKTATDLLDSRAPIYSDRPRNIVGLEILTGGYLLVLARYSEV